MKRQWVVYLTAAMLGSSGAALAQQAFGPQTGVERTVRVVNQTGGGQAVIVQDDGLPNRDVTAAAGRLPEGTEVAVEGKVVARQGDSLIIDRRDGQVRAEMAAEVSDPASRLAPGDKVVIYGRLRRVPEDLTQVDTEAVYDEQSKQTYLTTLGNERFAETSKGGSVAFHYTVLKG